MYSFTHWLSPATLPLTPRILGSYTRALLVNTDRRHLFVTPCTYTGIQNVAELAKVGCGGSGRVLEDRDGELKGDFLDFFYAYPDSKPERGEGGGQGVLLTFTCNGE